MAQRRPRRRRRVVRPAAEGGGRSPRRSIRLLPHQLDRSRAGRLAPRLGPEHAHRLRDRRPAGAIVWRLGGKKSDFAMGPGTRFAWQHDARRRPDGTITLFDNGAEPRVEKRSRVLVLRVDPARRRTTLVRSYVHPRGVLAGSQGNAQFLPDGHVFVGLGSRAVLHGVRPRGTCRARRPLRHRGRLLPRVPVPVERAAGRAPGGHRVTSRRRDSFASLRAGTERPRLPAGRCWRATTRSTSRWSRRRRGRASTRRSGSRTMPARSR